MAWWPRKSLLEPALVRENESLSAAIAGHKLREEIAAKKKLLAELDEEAAYQNGGSTARSRIEARRQREAAVKRNRVEAEQKALYEANRSRVIRGLDSEGLELVARAERVTRPAETVATVRGRIGESLADSLGFMPFDFGQLSGIFSRLYQVQGLIRELFPYKPTILRYIQALDFARWASRVLYEECPTAKGLVGGKMNFVIRRGTKYNLIRRDKKTDQTDDQKKARKFVDAFLEANDFHELEMERFRRRAIDGEAFMWIADPPNKDAPCEACFIEPDYVRPSQIEGQGQEDPHVGFSGSMLPDWSFGIHTARHKYYRPLAYQIVWNDNTEEKIDARYIVHAREAERSNIKRCLPPFLSASDDLIRMTILRAALADASRYRAAIAGVIEYEEASPGALEIGDEIYSGNIDLSGDSESWNLRGLRSESHASVLELAAGRKFGDGPLFPPGDSLGMIYDWHIQAIAQQWQVPEWLVKGASSGSSFADSLTAESPSVVEFETQQARECRFTKKAIKREIDHKIEQGLLPKTFWDRYNLDIQADSVVTRDQKAEVEAAQIEVQNQFCSLRTKRAQLGHDPDKEEQLILAEKALGLGPVWSPEAREGREAQPEGGAGTGSPKTMQGARQSLNGTAR